MSTSFHSAVDAPADSNDVPYWFIFRGFELLVLDEHEPLSVPFGNLPGRPELPLQAKHYLGVLELEGSNSPCYAAELPADFEAPVGTRFYSLRQLFDRLPDPFIGLAGRAVQIVDWDRTHRFCGRCGAPMEQLVGERAKKCPSCGLTNYPRLSPAMIVRVERPSLHGTEILLARNRRNPSGFYSVLAGFVEPGESLEECVRREVCEEVGLEIKNLRYYGSQPWPFPNSLMIAFTAEYASGEIRLEQREIADAGWYAADALPHVPPPISIARQLIDSFVEKNQN